MAVATWALLLLAAAPSPDAEVELQVMPPGCLIDSSTNLNLVTPLFERFEAERGRLDFESSGRSALARPGRWLLPESALGDVGLVRRVLATPEESLTRELLDPALEVLDSPWELNFQWPVSGHVDVIGRIMDSGDLNTRDTARRRVRLSRLTTPAGDRALELVLVDGSTVAAPSAEPLDWERAFAFGVQVRTTDDAVRLVALGKDAARGDRQLATLAAERRQADALLVQSGGFASEGEVQADVLDFCAGRLAALRPTAVAVRGDELELGPERLAALAKAHGLPLVAANLFDARRPADAPDARPFPRFVIGTHRGRRIAFVGLVAPSERSAISAAGREGWRVEDPVVALSQALDGVRTQLGGPADLVVVLVGGQDVGTPLLGHPRRVDLVLGSHPGGDLMERIDRVVLPPGTEGRERSRYPAPLMVARGNRYGVGLVRFEFAGTEPGARLDAIEHRVVPLPWDGPREPELRLAVRRLEEAELAAPAHVLLPDAAPLIDAHPDLEPLVFGDRIPHRGGFRRYHRPWQGRYSDPLWMRLLTRALLDRSGADVAIARAPYRAFDVIGPVAEATVHGWSGGDALRWVELRGDALQRWARAIATQDDGLSRDSARFLYAAGLDPARGRVAGRPIDPRSRYRVVTTDAVLALDEVRAAIGQPEAIDRFVTEGEGFVADPGGGTPLSVRRVVRAQLDRFVGPEGDFAAERRDDFLAALDPASERRRPRWTLALSELSVSGSRYANSANVGLFAATRQTRVSTPDNYVLGLGGDLALIYDGPSLAWETRGRLDFSRVVIEIEGLEVPAQEQADDLVAFTELRLNAVELSVGDSGVPIVPFLRATFDSELTATPDPSGGPDARFPHQKLLRGTLGLVARPGAVLREVRLGAVVEMDLSVAPLHQDFGLSAGYELAWPILPQLVVESSLDARWLALDDDDRISDLGLFLTATERVVVPLSDALSLYVFADLAAVRGKLDVNRELGGSLITGVGLRLSESFRLD